jgi:serine/threonine protein kinase
MGNSFKKAHGLKSGGKGGSKELSFKDKYSLGKELGSGAFSVVRFGTAKVPLEGTDARDFAIKVIQKASLSQEDLIGLQQEISIMKEINHRHVIRLFEYFEDPKEYFLVTELVAGGELFERIVKKSRYSELEARDCVKTILETMAYLHDQGVVHRDLKPENLLLTSKDDDAGHQGRGLWLRQAH